MNRLLLIWEMVPDEVKMFSIEEGTELASLAEQSAGLYINGDDIEETHAIFKLNELLLEIEDASTRETGVVTGPFTRVIICGFLL